MSTLDGFKTCKKGLHQYSLELRQCPECKRTASKSWREANPDYQRKQYYADVEKTRKLNLERVKRWNKQNPDKRKKISRKAYQKWRANNPEKRREWRQKNVEQLREYNAWRRALKKQATPAWAKREEIKKIYREAKRLEKETGIPHHVDHIYPLISPYLCGLHVENNLQILTSVENFTKNNKTWPGQLDCQKDPNPLFMRVE